MAIVQTMHISEFRGVIILTLGCAAPALPIVPPSYRIKSLLVFSASRKRVSSGLESSQYALRNHYENS
jgi:hypothetical protein